MNPDDLVLEGGALLIPFPVVHVCDKPPASLDVESRRGEFAYYRSACGCRWYERARTLEIFWYWKTLSPRQVKRLTRKGILPSQLTSE